MRHTKQESSNPASLPCVLLTLNHQFDSIIVAPTLIARVNLNKANFADSLPLVDIANHRAQLDKKLGDAGVLVSERQI